MTVGTMTGLHHVSFTVSDLPRSVAFYGSLSFAHERTIVVADAVGIGGRLRCAFMAAPGCVSNCANTVSAVTNAHPRNTMSDRRISPCKSTASRRGIAGSAPKVSASCPHRCTATPPPRCGCSCSTQTGCRSSSWSRTQPVRRHGRRRIWTRLATYSEVTTVLPC